MNIKPICMQKLTFSKTDNAQKMEKQKDINLNKKDKSAVCCQPLIKKDETQPINPPKENVVQCEPVKKDELVQGKKLNFKA